MWKSFHRRQNDCCILKRDMEVWEMPMFRKSLMMLILFLGVAAGGAMYGMYGEDEAIELTAAEKPLEVPEEKIVVYVIGAVNRPGVVTLKENARTADAVNACGGILPTADAEHVNMAQILKDGQKIRIPEKEAGNTAAPGEHRRDASMGKNGKININTADEKTLDELPGIGPAMAKRIVEYREREGMFRSPEELKNVRGIGEAKFEKLRDRVEI